MQVSRSWSGALVAQLADSNLSCLCQDPAVGQQPAADQPAPTQKPAAKEQTAAAQDQELAQVAAGATILRWTSSSAGTAGQGDAKKEQLQYPITTVTTAPYGSRYVAGAQRVQSPFPSGDEIRECPKGRCLFSSRRERLQEAQLDPLGLVQHAVCSAALGDSHCDLLNTLLHANSCIQPPGRQMRYCGTCPISTWRTSVSRLLL